jgi:hypothetical protein
MVNVQVSARITEEQVAQVDLLTKQMIPGMEIDRAVVLRHLIARGLEDHPSLPASVSTDTLRERLTLMADQWEGLSTAAWERSGEPDPVIGKMLTTVVGEIRKALATATDPEAWGAAATTERNAVVGDSP